MTIAEETRDDRNDNGRHVATDRPRRCVRRRDIKTRERSRNDEVREMDAAERSLRRQRTARRKTRTPPFTATRSSDWLARRENEINDGRL